MGGADDVLQEMDGLVQDCNISSANALEKPLSCTEPGKSIDICMELLKSN